MAKEKDKSKPKVVKMTDVEEKKKALESVFSVIRKGIRYRKYYETRRRKFG